jgi:hypothetical protein
MNDKNSEIKYPEFFIYIYCIIKYKIEFLTQNFKEKIL